MNKIINPPPLPMATVTGIGRVRNEKALKQLGQHLWGGPPKQDPGIEGLRRFPKESHKFFGRPLKTKDFNEIDELFKGPITSTGPKGTRTWDFSKARNEKFLKNLGDDLQKTRLQETGPERYNRLTGLDKSKTLSRLETQCGSKSKYSCLKN